MTLESRYGLKLEISERADSESFTATEQEVDAALEKIYALFQQETSAPLATLARNLRAWTRSHLQTEQIEQVITLATRARQEFSVLVTIGIGGSDLSARVFHDICNQPYHNLRSVSERGGAPEVYFTGDTFDPHKLIGLIEMLKARNLLYKTLFNVISKSGRTGETISTLMIIRDILCRNVPPENMAYAWQSQVVATTGVTEESALFQLHQESPFYGDILLPVPEGVGGRFSAFSPVGLFFLAMTAGKCDTPQTRIRAALQGVQNADDSFHLPYQHPCNVAYQLARWLQLAEARGKGTIVFYNYSDNSCLGEWFVQLYTESIQERGGGANVIPAKGPTSNHSILNGIIAGPRDKVVLFIHWEVLGDDLTIPKKTGIGGELTAFEGKSMSQIQTASYRGTAMDFAENEVANATLTLPKRDIDNVCQLMRILMDTVAIKGRLQGLHIQGEQVSVDNELTYRQDAVEGYKRRTQAIAMKMKS